MSILHVPVTFANIAEWVRRAGGAINQLITGKLDLTGGTLTGDLIVPDEAYGAGWNSSLEVPTKNALYDKIETIAAGGGTTTNPLTMNNGGAGAASGTTFDGSVARTISYNTIGAAASSHTHAQADVTGLTTADSPQFAGINLGHASDTTLTRVSAGVVAIEGVNVVTTAGGTFTGDISVPDEAYDATNWNGSVEVPTKNAVRDKIEGLPTGAWALAGTGQTATGVYDFAVDGAKATVDFTGLAGKTDIMLVARLVTQSVSGVLSLAVSTDNGSSYYTASGDYVVVGSASGAETNAPSQLFWATNATAARSGVLTIPAAAIGAPRPIINPNDANGILRLFVADLVNDIDAVRTYPSGGGNITGGKIYCFAR